MVFIVNDYTKEGRVLSTQECAYSNWNYLAAGRKMLIFPTEKSKVLPNL